MAKFERFHLIWLTGLSCDGCTIKALGEKTEGGLEALLTGRVAGIPPLYLLHPILSIESGDAFVRELERAERGDLEPFGLVNEASIEGLPADGDGFFSSLGQTEGGPTPFAEWLSRLAPRAQFVVAWGDCAVWGGPHSLEPNPAGVTGTAMRLGTDYRSRLGLPVVNLPGCAPAPVLIDALVRVLRWAQGEGPPPELDETNRPSFAYSDPGWEGAFAAWRG